MWQFLKMEVCTTPVLRFSLCNCSVRSVILGGFNDPAWNHLDCILCSKWFSLCDFLTQTEETCCTMDTDNVLHLSLLYQDKQGKAGPFLLPTSSLVDLHSEICRRVLLETSYLIISKLI